MLESVGQKGNKREQGAMIHIMKNSDETYLKITDIILFEMNVL